MAALLDDLAWPAVTTAGILTGTPRLGRTARITAHLVGWPLLLKVGLLTGFALAAAVRHLVSV